MITATKNKS